MENLGNKLGIFGILTLMALHISPHCVSQMRSLLLNYIYSFTHRWTSPILTILFRPFGLLVPKTFKIIWFSNLSTLSVPDEGYSRNGWCALNLISMFFLLHLLGHFFSIVYTKVICLSSVFLSFKTVFFTTV